MRWMVAQSTMEENERKLTSAKGVYKTKQKQRKGPFHGSLRRTLTYSHTGTLIFIWEHPSLHPSNPSALYYSFPCLDFQSAHHSSDSARISESEQLVVLGLCYPFARLLANDRSLSLVLSPKKTLSQNRFVVQQGAFGIAINRCPAYCLSRVWRTTTLHPSFVSAPLSVEICYSSLFNCPQTSLLHPCPCPGVPASSMHFTFNNWQILNQYRPSAIGFGRTHSFVSLHNHIFPSTDISFHPSIHPSCSSHKDSKAWTPKSVDWQKIVR